MQSLFIVIIYLAFISLGLPDPLLGVAWPVMRPEFGASFEMAGLISMVISGGTIISSLASGAVHKRLGAGQITLISCLMTALALLGFSLSPSLAWLFLLAIPLGLGAGSVDASLNNFVATHYKSHHMNWLHCFWGVGATLGPVIMSQFILRQNSWRSGYLTVSVIQFTLVVILFLTLPLWKRMGGKNDASQELEQSASQITDGSDRESEGKVKPLKIKGVKLAMMSFLFYCAAEATVGLWGSSFLVGERHLSAATAAQWVSLYYGGITAGRFVSGFITFKVSNKMLVRIGQPMSAAGVLLILLPLPDFVSLAGFILVGLGFAPIYPCMMHETPVRFGKENSQTIIGFQMALAYTGTTLLPPVLGFVAGLTTIKIFPFFVLAYIVIMLAGSERINSLMKGLGFSNY